MPAKGAVGFFKGHYLSLCPLIIILAVRKRESLIRRKYTK